MSPFGLSLSKGTRSRFDRLTTNGCRRQAYIAFTFATMP